MAIAVQLKADLKVIYREKERVCERNTVAEPQSRKEEPKRGMEPSPTESDYKTFTINAACFYDELKASAIKVKHNKNTSHLHDKGIVTQTSIY